MTFGSGKRCGATGKRTGEQCNNPAMAGSDFCFLHGGRPIPKRGAPKGNKNSQTHGANSKTIKNYRHRIAEGRALEPGFLAFNILNKDERETFLSMLGAMHEDFDPADSSEYYEIELIVLCVILTQRAVMRENFNAVESLDRMSRLHTNNLRSGAHLTYKRKKEHHPKTTSAEWTAAILNSVKKKEPLERAGQPEYKIEEDENEDEERYVLT